MWLASLEHEEENFGENSKTHRLEGTIPIGLFSRKFFVLSPTPALGRYVLNHSPTNVVGVGREARRQPKG